MPPSLSVILTSPRVPAGLLTATAWRVLDGADVVAAYDVASPLARVASAEGITVRAIPSATAAGLLDLAEHERVVWIAGPDGDDELVRDLAAEVVRRGDPAPDGMLGGPADRAAAGDDGGSGPVVEVVVGSYDPAGARLLDLVEVMDRLRRECPWDKSQTHESLVRYLVEEAYETIEAIESGDRDHLREELGDLLLQVMFHARLAAEDPDSPFDINDVAGGIVDKLVRRHPHVFGDVDATDVATVEANWDEIKAAEKARTSIMDGIAPGLPALALTAKVVERIAKGRAELSVPLPDDPAYTAETLGDVLFALVAAAFAANLDPEQALRARVRREIDAVRAQEPGVPGA